MELEEVQGGWQEWASVSGLPWRCGDSGGVALPASASGLPWRCGRGGGGVTVLCLVVFLDLFLLLLGEAPDTAAS